MCCPPVQMGWVRLQPTVLLHLNRAWVSAHLILENPDIAVMLQLEEINGR